MPSKLHLVASVLIHAVLAIAWIGPARLWQELPFQEQPAPLKKANGGTRFLSEKPLAKPVTPPEPKLESMVIAKADPLPIEKPKPAGEPPRRDYAGAPPSAAGPPPAKESVPTPNEIAARTPGPSAPVPAGDPALESVWPVAVVSSFSPDRKRLMASEQPHTDGDQVPIIDAVGLTSDGIDSIVRAGLGVLLVECETQQIDKEIQHYIVHGSVKSPTRLIPVTAHELRRYSVRALHLPPGECSSIRKQLKAEFAIVEPQLSHCRCLLVFSNRFDQEIYAAQCQAASSVGAKLNELAVTTGRFDYRGTDVAFRITAVTPHDTNQPKLLTGGR